jgi:hypothetical protein
MQFSILTIVLPALDTRSGERSLGVDDPIDRAARSQMGIRDKQLKKLGLKDVIWSWATGSARSPGKATVAQRRTFVGR